MFHWTIFRFGAKLLLSIFLIMHVNASSKNQKFVTLWYNYYKIIMIPSMKSLKSLRMWIFKILWNNICTYSHLWRVKKTKTQYFEMLIFTWCVHAYKYVVTKIHTSHFGIFFFLWTPLWYHTWILSSVALSAWPKKLLSRAQRCSRELAEGCPSHDHHLIQCRAKGAESGAEWTAEWDERVGASTRRTYALSPANCGEGKKHNILGMRNNLRRYLIPRLHIRFQSKASKASKVSQNLRVTLKMPLIG